MTFEQWLTANGYDAERLSATQRTHLQAAWKAETSPPPLATPVAPAPAAATPAAPPAPTQPAPTPTVFEAELEAARKEGARCQRIDEITSEQIRKNVRFPERVERFNLLRVAAVESGWDLQKFQLELLKEHHTLGGPIINVARSENITSEVIEAAAMRGVGFPCEKHYSEQVMSTVDKKFKRGLGLREMIQFAAEVNNGYRGSSRDLPAMCRAAFTDRSGDPQFRSDAAPSTMSVPGILSNLANKFLEAGFLFTEQAWRQIAKIRPANDYKTMNIYRLGGSNKFEKVSRAGELKHGSLSELSYTLKADIYGKILGISEEDIRNDDLSAFAQVGDEIGRGGGDSLNDIFWTEFLADTAFFPTDKSLLNYDDGAVDSLLNLVGLNNAETMFRLQTKPDGTALGAMPAILLTPASLYNTGLQLMGSQGLVVGTTPASGPQQNVFYGRYRTVSSVFLDAASTTAWYLLADPNNIAAIAICFLDGVQTPTVETGTFDFDRLGIAMRGTMRFGVSKQEYRAGVKLKGAA